MITLLLLIKSGLSVYNEVVHQFSGRHKCLERRTELVLSAKQKRMKRPFRQSTHICGRDSKFPRAPHTQEHHHRITSPHDFRVRRNYSCHHPHLPTLHIFHFQGKLGHNKVEELGQCFVASQLPNEISKIFAFFLLHSSKG